MKLLHINNGYVGSKVHANLMRELDGIGIEQTLYCPIRDVSHDGLNRIEADKLDFIYSYCIKKWHRFFYNWKAKTIFSDLESKVNIANYTIIHAATLFSDGAIAYKAFKKYGIPYVIAVRSVDTSDFIENRMYHTWPLGKKIVRNAKFIYFISQAGMDRFTRSEFAKPLLNEIKEKLVLRPNGIDKSWLNNINTEPTEGRTVCYIGTFMKRKNVDRLINAIKKLRTIEGYNDVKLKIIGGGYSEDGSTDELVNSNLEFIEYEGRINDMNIIRTKMKECALFAMPSFTETFGLVYIEALSQNLPVVYTQNDGIDGLFDNTVGIGADPMSVVSIMNAIKRILDHRDYYGNRNINFNTFSWTNIATLYLEDYKK